MTTPRPVCFHGNLEGEGRRYGRSLCVSPLNATCSCSDSRSVANQVPLVAPHFATRLFDHFSHFFPPSAPPPSSFSESPILAPFGAPSQKTCTSLLPSFFTDLAAAEGRRDGALNLFSFPCYGLSSRQDALFLASVLWSMSPND